MGRIRAYIDVNGEKRWTLFDSGARNSYVVRRAAKGLVAKKLSPVKSTLLGGKAHKIAQTCILTAKVEGHPIDTHAGVVDEIGKDEDGRPIEVLFGALAMQEWGVRLDVPNEKLDLTHYTREFVEF